MMVIQERRGRGEKGSYILHQDSYSPPLVFHVDKGLRVPPTKDLTLWHYPGPFFEGHSKRLRDLQDPLMRGEAALTTVQLP